MKTQKYKLTAGAFDGTEEWSYKEYGSFEDHNESDDHVYNLISALAFKDNYIMVTWDQLKQLHRSLFNALSYDTLTPPQRGCMEGYKRRIEKLLNNPQNIRDNIRYVHSGW